MGIQYNRIQNCITHFFFEVTMAKLPSMTLALLTYIMASLPGCIQSFSVGSYDQGHKHIREIETAKLYAEVVDSETTNLNQSNRTVTILSRGANHIVALKPPSVVCHHSGWTGSRSKLKRGEEPEIPMLQRVRDGIHDIDSRNVDEGGEKPPMRKVNLVHRLDRGASGALLLAYADNDGDQNKDFKRKGATATLIQAMASPESTKTYVALVRGEGILRGEDFKEKGWFEVSRPIKDESGEEKNATTLFNFVAGQPETCENGVDRPRISLVLARPKEGRWHQIRRHLNGLSHPILGDTTHVSFFFLHLCKYIFLHRLSSNLATFIWNRELQR